MRCCARCNWKDLSAKTVLRNVPFPFSVSSPMGKRGVSVLFALLLASLCGGSLFAQKSRLTGALENTNRVPLTGHLQPRATPANDQGPAESELTLRNLSLVLKPSAEQQAALDALLSAQQNPSSPDYHHWLTPEEYATRFGVAQADIDRITAWLRGRNLTVVSVARARNSIQFSGPVRQVEAAFQTEIHRYLVGGELHFANATEPSLPAALTGMVTAIRGLHDFRPTARKIRYAPAYTSGVDGTTHYLTPDDIATIYDVRPLLNAGFDGAGQKVAIVGQTQVDVGDIHQFRTAFNLPPNDPQLLLVPGLPDPGVSQNDLGEADLDIEWTGAMARKATLIYVYSNDVTDAAQYVIDQNLAPVMTMSYGLCESLTGRADLTTLRTLAQQANAEGMTWLAAAGDNGGADCYDTTSRTTALAGVDAPASVPEVTGVGGTQFNEGSGTFWNLTNDGNQASASGYIPEMVWNESASQNSPAAGGGGVSSFFTKPAWQTGPGVPNDGARDVPDVSFSAAAGHDPFLFFSGGARGVVGGTSVSSPVFAGILALLNQYQVKNGFQTSAGLGNINPQLYAMAQSAPGAFHDVTVGDNLVNPCPARNRACGAKPVGYSAGPGYDTASGLGSLDAFNLITAWHLKSALQTTTLSVISGATSISLSGSVTLTATVAGAGSGTPTGTVTWSLAGVTLGSAPLALVAGKATATLNVPASQLTQGIVSISAAYGGDSLFAGSAGTVSLTVLPPAPLTITGITNAASFRQVYAPGMILAVFGTSMAGATQSAPLVPLPTQLNGTVVTVNGYLSPLYFVSPTQINVQIPNFTPVGAAVLKVSYAGQSATIPFNVTAGAPGVFTDAAGAPVPNGTAKRGDTITLFVTGEGTVTPAPSSGNVPTSASIPKPVQTVSLTVGGATAVLPFVGVPAWAIGLSQINYTVPMNAPLGPQPVVITVGNTASSAPAILTVTP